MEKKVQPYPGHSEIVFQAPLYGTFEITDQQEHELLAADLNVEGHCVECGKERVFSRQKTNARMLANMTHAPRLSWNDKLSFECAFKPEHKLYVYVVLENGLIEKCGQKPSFADVVQGQDVELAKMLNNEDRREYNKAIGLASHDTGIGAYAYLRRIFERLIYGRFVEHKAARGWADEDFYKKRMNEKIAFLRDYLPPLLVKNAASYGILSDGLHNLTEGECLAFFPALRQGTLLILQEDREEKERRKAEAAFTKEVSTFKSRA
jgi:hypothetical protein